MNDVNVFLDEVLPKLKAADTALHNGDAGVRAGMWSHDDPVSLFGAAVNATGWQDISATFDWLASRFSDCTRFDCEVVAAGVGTDVAYLVAIEHTTASVGGGAPSDYSLRVTTIFRREAGDWKIVHRHGDPFDPSATTMVGRLREA
jgi:ketosteroid isomerase-like protein